MNKVVPVYAIFMAVLIFAFTVCGKKGVIGAHQSSAVSDTDKAADPSRLPIYITDAQCIDQTHWVVTGSEEVWITRHAANTWKKIYHAKKSSDNPISINLYFLSRSTGFILADKKLLRTDDGGASWTEVGVIPGDSQSMKIWSCYFLDRLRGWAVGTIFQPEGVNDPEIPFNVGAVFRTIDGGRTWQRQELGLSKGELMRSAIYSVLFKNAHTGWAAGNQVIFWTKDGGETWNLAKTPEGNYDGLFFIDGNNGWSVENRGTLGFARTTDGGRRWKWFQGPGLGGDWPVYIVFLSPEQGIAARHGLHQTSDGGRTWQRIAIGGGADEWEYVYFGQARDGTLVGLHMEAGNVKAVISTDRGQTWQILPSAR